jgi:hypothetical protein
LRRTAADGESHFHAGIVAGMRQEARSFGFLRNAKTLFIRARFAALLDQ